MITRRQGGGDAEYGTVRRGADDEANTVSV